MSFGVASTLALLPSESECVHFSLASSSKVLLFLSLLTPFESVGRGAFQAQGSFSAPYAASNEFSPFVPLPCLLTASRCGEQRHDTCVQPVLYATEMLSFYFMLLLILCRRRFVYSLHH